jgi:hypothetical protein
VLTFVYLCVYVCACAWDVCVCARVGGFWVSASSERLVGTLRGSLAEGRRRSHPGGLPHCLQRQLLAVHS